MGAEFVICLLKISPCKNAGPPLDRQTWLNPSCGVGREGFSGLKDLMYFRNEGNQLPLRRETVPSFPLVNQRWDFKRRPQVPLSLEPLRCAMAGHIF